MSETGRDGARECLSQGPDANLNGSRSLSIAAVLIGERLVSIGAATAVASRSGPAAGGLLVVVWLALTLLNWPLGRWLARRWKALPPSRAGFLMVAMPTLMVLSDRSAGLSEFGGSVLVPGLPMLLLWFGLGLHRRERG